MNKNSIPDLEPSTSQEENKFLFLSNLLVTSNVRLACEASGLPASFYSKWFVQDPAFRHAARTFLTQPQYLNDFAESVLIRKVLEEDFAAIKFWLKNRHPAYRNGDGTYHTKNATAPLEEALAKAEVVEKQIENKSPIKSPYKTKLEANLINI